MVEGFSEAVRAVHALALHWGCWGAPRHGGGPGNWRKQQVPTSASYTAKKWLMDELEEREKNPVESTCVRCRAVNVLKIQTYKATLKSISF